MPKPAASTTLPPRDRRRPRKIPTNRRPFSAIIIAALMRRRAAGIRAVYRDVLRQPAGKRPCRAKRRARPCRRAAPTARMTGSPKTSPFPVAWSTASRRRQVRREIDHRARGNSASSDAAPVVCEPFRQWVLEDRFPQGRPALETVGVEFVEDVAPYELMKLRILNGGHATIAYLGRTARHPLRARGHGQSPGHRISLKSWNSPRSSRPCRKFRA